MPTLWPNGDRGFKSTSGQQSSGQYSLTSYKFVPSPTILFKEKFAKSAFFHNFASFQVNKCPLFGQIETEASNRPQGNKAADSTLLHLIRILPSPRILFNEKIAKSTFFHNFASFQVNKRQLFGQMETGA